VEIKYNLMLPALAKQWVGKPVLKDGQEIGKVVEAHVDGKAVVGKILLHDGSEYMSKLIEVSEC